MKRIILSPVPGSKRLLFLVSCLLISAVASSIDAANNDVITAEKILPNNNDDFLNTLTARTNESTEKLSQISAEYSDVQSKLYDKLARFTERQSSLQAELKSSAAIISDDTKSSSDAVQEGMDEASFKLLQLMKRTEHVAGHVAEWNRAEIFGSLKQRLAEVKDEEIQRRDRFAQITSDAAEEVEDEALPSYITRAELDEILSSNKILTPSEHDLKSKFMALAMDMMEERTTNDSQFWEEHFAALPQQIQQHVQKQLRQQELNNSNNDGSCIDIPSAVQLVANALASQYQDGGVGMADVASYENGGSVVYELTSAPYKPPPRNNDEQEFPADKEALERMYYEQQQLQSDMINSGESAGIAQKMNAEIDKIDIWNWYTSFKFDSMRKYLPDDWERALDSLSSSGYLGGSTTNWGDFTPRGVIDALIPDYIYHAFGVSNTASYGSVYGRTASPEVAITVGYSKVGGNSSGGWNAKALGNCYPLSMHPENDPVLPLLARFSNDMEGEATEDEDDARLSFLVGPKYTVRLPYPIHIDAVSVEHRAFPLPQSALNDGVRGGESAPRWVKMVGFPPCASDDNENLVDTEAESCDKLGFDISQPIELGSFEYHPVTVSGKEYGDEKRRRSIQTFTVKGGKVKESAGIEVEDDSDDDIAASDQPKLEVDEYEIPPGSCAPPKEPDDVPSCGSEVSSSSDQSERQVVSAVSFIIEENWGNNDYTCLYRVRVHGDPIQE